MLEYLNKISKNRLPWALLLASSATFLSCGFFFQYVMNLEPCHLCIIQRIAFLIIGIGGAIALIKPHLSLFRLLGLMVWSAGVSLGLYAANKLVQLQLNPPTQNLFSSCEIDATSLMNSYGFLEWFPMMFEAKGSCTESAWSFYGILTMEQITLLIFCGHAIAFLLILISQFFYKKNQ